MDYLLENLEEEGDKKIGTPLPTHLDTPLRDHEPLLILGRKKLDPRVKGFLKFKIIACQHTLSLIKRDSFLGDLTNNEIQIGFAKIQKNLFDCIRDLEVTNRASRLLLTSSNVASSNLINQSKSLEIPSFDPTLSRDELLLIEKYFSLRLIFQDAVLLTGCPNENKDEDYHGWKKIGTYLWVYNLGKDIKIYANKFMSCVCSQGQIFLGTRDHLLGLHDIIVQRGTVYHSSFLAELKGDTTYPDKKEVTKALLWGDRILERFGNEGYNLIGQWESMCVGVLATLVDDYVWDNTIFLNQMKHEFVNEDEGLLTPYWEKATRLLTSAGKKNWSRLTQLYGLYRIWGHPTVNSQAGIAKLRTYACKIKPINYMMVDTVTINMKERFCMDYRAKHNSWPKLNIESLSESSYLRECIDNNNTLFIRDPRYNRNDWLLVKGEKTFEILPKYNLVKLLSDKAMSLDLNEIVPYLEKGSIGPAWSRSVLYKWLVNNIGDPKVFLEEISRAGFGEHEKIVGVCPKERELKLFARLFGLLTMKKRMYVVLTEALIAEHLIPYFPEITMLDDHITLMKKMYANTNKRDNSGYVPIYTSLDFQKWNSHMREEETMQIFTFMDELFGLEKVFTRTHEMFKDSQLYLADGTYIPTIGVDGRLIEDENCWSGHLGGIEGLRQKGWTIFTVCILRMVMDDYGYQYALMGQGDNQVLKINYPRTMTDQDIQRAHKEILKRMDDVLAQIGPPLKLSESWSSSNLFLYGKFPIFTGAPLSMSIKRLCRMFSLDNEGFPTLDSSLSSLMANVQSACNYSYNISIPFYLYIKEVCLSIQTFYHFNYLGIYPIRIKRLSDIRFGVPREGGRVLTTFPHNPTWGRQIMNMDEGILRKMTIFPKILGGYSICLMGNLLSNGFPDPVSENICLLKKLHQEQYEQETITSILSPTLKTWFEADLLCEDPVSLNLMHPSSPKESMKRLVQKFLSSADWIRNDYFKEFLGIAFHRQKPLCNLLIEMQPCNPRIMHSVVEATLVGRAIQVVGQLDKTNTLTSMMLSTSDIDANKEIARTEQQYFFSVLCNLYMRGDVLWEPSLCSRVHSQKLRNVGWGRIISGVTVAPIMEAFEPTKADEFGCMRHLNRDKGYFLLTPDLTTDHARFRDRMAIGKFTPFLGSKTEVKTQSYGRDLARKSQPLLKNAAELLNLINWGTEEHSNLGRLIKDIFSSLTDINPDLFVPLTGQVSGSTEHRWDDSSTKHGGNLSILYTPATFFHLSSNSLIGYQAQGVNYNLHFQALMGIATCWANEYFSHFDFCPFHLHISCTECIVEINEDMMDIPNYKKDEILLSLPGNPICWVSSESIPLVQNVGGEMIQIRTLREKDPLSIPAFYEVVAEKCVSLMRSKSFEAGDGRQKPAVLGGLNISWNGKLDYAIFLSYVTLTLIGFICFRADRSLWKRWKSPKDMLSHVKKYISNLPCLHFTWSSTLYLNTRLMDEMNSQNWSAQFPRDVPLSLSSVGRHTQNQILNLLDEWTYNSSVISEKKIFISGVSKIADYHPIFKILTYHLITSTDPVFNSSKEMFGIFRSIIGSYSMDLGNNIHPEWAIRNNFRSIYERARLPLISQRDLLEFNRRYTYVVINNNMDYLCKSLPIKEDIVYLNHDISSTDLMRLPPSRGMLIPISSSRVSDDMSEFSIPKVDWSEAPLDLDVIKSRVLTYPTSAPYKLLECLREFELAPNGRVAAIADGAGGFSLTLARFREVNEVFYNSLFKLESILDQAAPNFIPPSFVGEGLARQKLIHLDYNYSGSSDITSHQFWEQMEVMNDEKAFSLVCCDAEAGEAGDSYQGCNIVYKVITGCSLLNIPNVIVKAYLNPFSLIHIYTAICASAYHDIAFFKGVWSSIENREIYIFCTKPLVTPRKCSLSRHRVKGPSLNKRSMTELEKLLTSFWSKKNPILKQVKLKYTKYLVIREGNNQDDRMLRTFMGDWTDQSYIFPWSMIKFMKEGVVPIRFGRVKRKMIEINLIKHQLMKKWAMGWLLGLLCTQLDSAENIEAYFKSAWLVIFSTKRGWSFWVTINPPKPQFPSTKVEKLTSLVNRHELKPIIRLANFISIRTLGVSKYGMLTGDVKREFKLYKWLPLDEGVRIWSSN